MKRGERMPRTRRALREGNAAQGPSDEPCTVRAFRGMAHAWFRRALCWPDPPYYGGYTWPT